MGIVWRQNPTSNVGQKKVCLSDKHIKRSVFVVIFWGYCIFEIYFLMSLTNATTAATNFAKKKTKKVQKSGKKQSELKLVFLAFWSTKTAVLMGGESVRGCSWNKKSRRIHFLVGQTNCSPTTNNNNNPHCSKNGKLSNKSGHSFLPVSFWRRAI